jgi:prephenate dehydrogenase
MNIGIVGLGLIGGSLAKALKLSGKHKIYGFDADGSTLEFAIMTQAVDSSLTDERLSECDFVIIALYPQATIEYIESKAQFFKKSAIVVDCCGVKGRVCHACYKLALENGFNFIGGHPMAGTQYSGFKFSKENLFRNAKMILVPASGEDISLLERTKTVFMDAGFSGISIATPEKHDKIIAYTSQLAHVVSNAYVKSPSAQIHKGFSAGSYKDLTRVARLNETMWTELFLDNADNLANEIDFLISSLQKYSNAIKAHDFKSLETLLREGRECKERAESGKESV